MGSNPIPGKFFFFFQFFFKPFFNCVLLNFRANCNVNPKDIVNILTEKETDGSFIINEFKGILILNPHFILSGTAILSSLHCLRKSTLNWKFKDNGMNTIHLVLGNLLHSLFQYAITNKKYKKDQLDTLLLDLLKKKQIVKQLYESEVSEETLLKEASQYLVSIEKWLQEHIKLPLTNQFEFGKKNVNANNNVNKNLNVLKVQDIEESIWSPKYGVKGKLDLTLEVEIKPHAFKNLKLKNKQNPSSFQSHIIPVELKSGRTTYSIEHEGQVMLYSLLNEERKNMTDFGLLLYLKENNMKFVQVNHNSLKGEPNILELIKNIFSLISYDLKV
jgi:DNA replication ATP-dependent helicase Dna2